MVGAQHLYNAWKRNSLRFIQPSLTSNQTHARPHMQAVIVCTHHAPRPAAAWARRWSWRRSGRPSALPLPWAGSAAGGALRRGGKMGGGEAGVGRLDRGRRCVVKGRRSRGRAALVGGLTSCSIKCMHMHRKDNPKTCSIRPPAQRSFPRRTCTHGFPVKSQTHQARRAHSRPPAQARCSPSCYARLQPQARRRTHPCPRSAAHAQQRALLRTFALQQVDVHQQQLVVKLLHLAQQPARTGAAGVALSLRLCATAICLRERCVQQLSVLLRPDCAASLARLCSHTPSGAGADRLRLEVLRVEL